MAKKHLQFGPILQQQRSSALPSAIAGIVVWIFIAINGIGIWRQEKADLVFLLGVGAVGTIFLIAFNFFIIPAFNFEPVVGWIYAGMAGMGMGLLTYVLPEQSDIYLDILWITLAITCALISGRRTSYFLLFLAMLLTVIMRRGDITNVSDLILHLSFIFVAAIMVETIMQLKKRQATIFTNWKSSPILVTKSPQHSKRSRLSLYSIRHFKIQSRPTRISSAFEKAMKCASSFSTMTGNFTRIKTLSWKVRSRNGS